MDKGLCLLAFVCVAIGVVRCQGGGWGGEMGGAGGGLDLFGQGTSIFDMLYGMLTDSPAQVRVPAQNPGMGAGGMPVDINLLQSQASGGRANQNIMSYLPGVPGRMPGRSPSGMMGGLQGSGLSAQEMLFASLLAGRRGGAGGGGGEGEGGGAGGGEGGGAGGGEGGGAGGGEGGGAGGGEGGGAGGEEGGGAASTSGMPSFRDLLRARMLRSQSSQFPQMNQQQMSSGRLGMGMSMPRQNTPGMGMAMPSQNNLGMGMAMPGQNNLGMGMAMPGQSNLGTGMGMSRMNRLRMGMAMPGMNRVGMGMGMPGMGMSRGSAAGQGGEAAEGGAASGAGGEGGGAAGGEGSGAGAGGEGGAAGGGGEGGGRSGMDWALLAMQNPQFRKMSGNILSDFTGSIFRMIDGAANTLGLPLGGRRQTQNVMTQSQTSMPSTTQRFGNNPFSGTKMSQSNLRSMMMNNEQSKATSGMSGSAMQSPFGMPPGFRFPPGVMSSIQKMMAGMSKNGNMPGMGSKTAWAAAGMAGRTGGASVAAATTQACPEFPYAVKNGQVVFEDINMNCRLSVDLHSTSSPPTRTNTGIVPLTTGGSPSTTTPGTNGPAQVVKNGSPLAQMQNKQGGDTVAMCPPWKVWRRDREIHVETVPGQCHIIVTSMKGIPGIQGSNSVQVRFSNGGGQTPRSI